MAETNAPRPGTILWHDLTVEHAGRLREFYEQVAGWQGSPVEMQGYSDFTMSPPGGDPVAGVCHARGPNADLPPQWLMYIGVADLDAAIAACERLGGRVVRAPKTMGGARYCVIADPAGAVCALFQPAPA